jgi:hypothetical protein
MNLIRKKFTIAVIIGILFFLSTASLFFLNKSTIKTSLIQVNKSEYRLFVGKATLEFFSKDGKKLGSYNIQSKGNRIIDFCIADIDNNGNEKVLLLIGKPNGVYAKELIIFGLKNVTSEKSLEKVFEIEEIYKENVEALNPWKILTGDVDGDEKVEISLGVYKTSRFHPVLAKRPFIYNWNNNELTPKWLGSRLSRPFDDYIFADIDDDKLEELISIEYLESGKKVIASYKWKGFGFESIGQSKEFDDITDIDIGEFSEETGYDLIATVKNNNKSLRTRFKYGNNSIMQGKIFNKE